MSFKLYDLWAVLMRVKPATDIQKLLDTIDRLEKRLGDLEAQLKKEIASREAVESLYQDQLHKNKFIVEQNSLFKTKLEKLINKQDNILAVLDIIMKNTNIKESQKEIIYKLLEI